MNHRGATHFPASATSTRTLTLRCIHQGFVQRYPDTFEPAAIVRETKTTITVQRGRFHADRSDLFGDAPLTFRKATGEVTPKRSYARYALIATEAVSQ